MNMQYLELENHGKINLLFFPSIYRHMYIHIWFDWFLLIYVLFAFYYNLDYAIFNREESKPSVCFFIVIRFILVSNHGSFTIIMQ